MNTKELERIFDEVLVPLGFRRRRDTWSKSNEDTITLLDLQKSQWGGQYYVNLAIYLRELGTAAAPAEHQAHIRVRLDSIGRHFEPSIAEALDLERTEMSADARKATLTRALREVAVPFLLDRSVIPMLRALLAKAELGPVLITRTAREFLERMT